MRAYTVLHGSMENAVGASRRWRSIGLNLRRLDQSMGLKRQWRRVGDCVHGAGLTLDACYLKSVGLREKIVDEEVSLVIGPQHGSIQQRDDGQVEPLANGVKWNLSLLHFVCFVVLHRGETCRYILNNHVCDREAFSEHFR